VRLRRPRLEPLGDADLSPRQGEALASLGRRGSLNIYRTAAAAPEALEALLGVGRYLVSAASALGPREIAILRSAWRCRCGYVWTQHAILARQAGLTEAEIAAVKRGAGAPAWTTAERSLIQACDELVADQFVGEATWETLAGSFDARRRMDLVFTVGHYVHVAMIVNTFGVQLDGGLALDPDLADLDNG
jgi:4-carboxymuconolactone decarboxylase